MKRVGVGKDAKLNEPNGVTRKKHQIGGDRWVSQGWWKRDEEVDRKVDARLEAARVEKEAKLEAAREKAKKLTGVVVRKKAAESRSATGIVTAVTSPQTPTTHVAEMASSNLLRWRAEPWTFVREVFRAEPDDWQDEFLHALVQHDKLALKACKGPGKSCGLAWAVWWFMSCFSYPKVLATSITGDNLRDGLWAELAKWRTQSPFLLQLFEWQTERIYLKESPETWFASARTWPKDADKSKQANTLAGQHAQHSMVVVDEAGDIPESVVAAGLAHHATQGDAVEVHKTLMAGNPTRVDGALGVACTRDRAHWWVKEITGDPDDPRRARRIDPAWAREQIEKWGRENAWVLVNVFGQFPPTQADKLLGAEQVRTSMGRNPPENTWENEPLIFGIDVARQGDDRSVVFPRKGRVAFRPWVFRIDDTMELASRIARLIDAKDPDAVFVDGTGIGAGVYDRLVQLGYDVIEVNFGSKAGDGKRFLNRRAEMWWSMADWVKDYGSLPDVPELMAELTGPSYWFNATDKLCLESKDDMKLRGLASPDLADALALTFATRVIGKRDREARARHMKAITDWDPFAQPRKEIF